MKRISIFIVLIAGLMVITGCQKSENQTPAEIMANRTSDSAGASDDGKLTTAKAQGALSRWMGKDGEQVTVQGIQEVPQENAAKADITFTDFEYKSNEGLGESEKTYSGPATAVFTHYNDGRWVLTKILIERGAFDTVSWNNLKVEAR